MIRIGHRGAAGYAPENTMASFEKAIRLGVDYVELDIQSTKDGQIVVFHDRLLDRMTNGTGYIWDFTYNEIRGNIVINNSEETIPRLEDVCHLFSTNHIRLYVDVITPGIESRALSLLTGRIGVDRFIIGSFDHQLVRNIKSINPQVRTIAIMECSPVNVSQIISDTNCDYLSLGSKYVNANIIKEAKRNGVKVFAWTVDDRREIKRVKELGIDGIISNFPDRI